MPRDLQQEYTRAEMRVLICDNEEQRLLELLYTNKKERDNWRIIMANLCGEANATGAPVPKSGQ